ncbi:MAG: DUF91 domain-containing protein [Cyanobacteria bacterium]|jgi:hypothetical protein|nr:DUF91 domain-containing protein [Cyanobacteria bacterium GSL.Bin21]
MLYSVPLQISQQLVEFERESDLEELLWQNLNSLNHLSPLARQHYVQGQYCDLLATDADKGLHIIEIKISEDRYVIQQLTRYYHALIEEKDFNDCIDYSKPIKLIAILPTIHRDNLIDIQYSKLSFDLLTYKISLTESKKFSLIFQDLNGHNVGNCITSPYTQKTDGDDRTQLSSSFLKLLKYVDNEKETEKIIKTRSLIVGYSSKVKEVVTGSANSAVTYGLNKTKLISEFRFDKSRDKIVLFLWLPHRISIKRRIHRLRIWTDWEVVTAVGYMRKGIGKMISHVEFQEFHHSQFPAKIRPEDINKFETNIEYRNSWISKKSYLRFNAKHGNPLAMDSNFYLSRLIKPNFPDKNESQLNLGNYGIKPEHYSISIDNPVYPPLESFIKLALASRLEGLV